MKCIKTGKHWLTGYAFVLANLARRPTIHILNSGNRTELNALAEIRCFLVGNMKTEGRSERLRAMA